MQNLAPVKASEREIFWGVLQSLIICSAARLKDFNNSSVECLWRIATYKKDNNC